MGSTISLVTGGNRGIGREICRQLAALGHTVVLTARSPEAAERAAKELGPGVHPARLDVTSDDDARRAAEEVEHVSGDLDRPESRAPALRGARGLFLLPGYRDMPGILEQARRAGVERVVLLSGGSAGSGDMSNAITRYMVVSERA